MISSTIKSKIYFASIAATAVMAMTSCAKFGKLTADNFTATPTPLETQAGQVPTTINANFQEKFMPKKGVITITPELRGADGTIVKGTPATFQGEKFMGNDQVISNKLGGKATMRTSFPYADALHKSDLYLTFSASIGSKKFPFPDLKVGYGVIATSELYRQCLQQTGGCIAPDAYQRIVAQKQEANIKFLINQAQLRKSELKNNTVTEFVELLKKINNEKESYNISSIDVKAYASPDGAESFNDKLANKRMVVSQNYTNATLKNINLTANVATEYTAEDWDGFQQLVSASNIQDKDVILRVLSMYKDPVEREQQIKNMSAGFRELADGILPELRRSRLILNYEIVGRSDKQIQEQFAADPSKLSVDELLYDAAINGTSTEQKAKIYETAAKLYPNDYRTYNNVAAVAISNGDLAKAKQNAEKALAVNPKAAEPQANLAMIALKNGDVATAQNCLSKATTGNDYKKALGTLNIAKGNYTEAAQNLRGMNNNMAALAQILTKDYASAKSTLNAIGNNGDAMTYYLQAINSARQQDKAAASSYLQKAIAKDASLQKYADEDLELK